MNDNILTINREYQEIEDKIGELYEQIQILRDKESKLKVTKVTSALKKNTPYHFKHWFENTQDWYGIVHDLWYDRTDEKYVFEFCGFCGEFEENYSDMCWLSVDVDNQWSEIGQTFIEDFINSFEEIAFDEFMNKYDEYREKHDKAFREWVNYYKDKS